MTEPQLLIQMVEFIKADNRQFYTQTHKGPQISLQQFVGDLQQGKSDYQVMGPIMDESPGIKTHIIYVLCKVHSNSDAAEHFMEKKPAGNNGGTNKEKITTLGENRTAKT